MRFYSGRSVALMAGVLLATLGFVTHSSDAVQAKVTLGAGFKTCIYYKGDAVKKENVQECKTATIANGVSSCDDPADASIKVQGSPKAADEIDMCKLNQKCCLLYIDDDQDGKWDKGEAKACHPANVGCNTLFLTSESNDTKAPKDKVQFKQLLHSCANEYSCTGKIDTVDAAQQKFDTNTKLAAQKKSQEVTLEDANEAQKASLAAGKAVWTKTLCEKAGNIWSPPAEESSSGDYCFAPTKDAKLGVSILGYNAATLTSYIPLIFRYSLGLLALMTLLSIVYAGLLWSTNAGNPEAVTTAKSVIVGSFVGLTIALGGYTLLKTVNPALLELRPPAITAILPIEMLEVTASNICCQGVSCLQLEAKGGQTQIVAAGFGVIPLPFGDDEEKMEEIKGCPSMNAEGEYCKTKGPFNDACVAAGGTCVVQPDSNAIFGDLTAGADKSQQGWCSSLYYNYLVPIAVGGLAGIADLAFKPMNILVNKFKIDPSKFTNKVAGGYLEFESSEGIEKVAAAAKDFLTNPDPKGLIPGDGPVGRCTKNIDTRVSGQYCTRNEECASGTCVRLPGTASCFVDREMGICSGGKVRDICHPLNHTLVGGWNTFTEKPTCQQGLFCKFVKTSTSATWNPDKIPGDHYECSDGKLGSACGQYSANCADQSAGSDDCIKKFAKEGPFSAGLCLYKNFSDCDDQPTLLGKAFCNFERQKKFVADRTIAHAALVGVDLTASVVDGLSAYAGPDSGVAKYSEAIAHGFDIAKEASDMELDKAIKKLENYRYQIDHTSPDAKNCPIENSGMDTTICGSGLSCQAVGLAVNIEMRCNVKDGGKTEGTICTYHGSHTQKFLGSDKLTSGDTCYEAGGLKCSVGRHPEYVNTSDFYGFCTKGTWQSPCIVNPDMKKAGHIWSYEPQDCSGVKDPFTDATAKAHGIIKSQGAPVCYAVAGDDKFGACAWLAPNASGSTDAFGYLVSYTGELYLDPGDLQKKIPVTMPAKNAGSYCTIKSKDTKKWEKNLECVGVLDTGAFGSWRDSVFKEDPDCQEKTETNASFKKIIDEGDVRPMCIRTSEGSTIGKCGGFMICDSSGKNGDPNGIYLGWVYAPFAPFGQKVNDKWVSNFNINTLYGSME